MENQALSAKGVIGPGARPRSEIRFSAKAVLGRAYHAGLLDRPELQKATMFEAGGSLSMIYTLGLMGARLLAELDELV